VPGCGITKIATDFFGALANMPGDHTYLPTQQYQKTGKSKSNPGSNQFLTGRFAQLVQMAFIRLYDLTGGGTLGVRLIGVILSGGLPC